MLCTLKVKRITSAQLEWACWGAVALVLGTALFWRLGSIPAGLYHDETITAYDARCVLRTGADHFGVRLPLFFESFPGDWKSPVYTYLAALNEAVLGPTDAAVRLTSVEFVLAIVVSVFFVLRTMTRSSVLARWMAVFTLTVPTVFFYARVSTAENICLAGMTAVALVPLLQLESRPSYKLAALAGLMLGLTAYTYHVGRLLGPLMIVAAAASMAPDARLRPHVPAFLGVAALTGLPMALFVWLHPDTLTHRFSRVVGLWSDNPTPAAAARRFAGTYLQHFVSPDFLFRTGQHQDNINFGAGFLPIWICLPLVFGIASLWERRRSPFARFLFAMLFISPIPVALTRENLPHTGRITHIIVFEMIIAGLAVADWLARFKPDKLVASLAVGAVMVEAVQNGALYFGDYADKVRRDRPFGDENIGDALRIVSKTWNREEPLNVPSNFFKTYGTYLQFYLDLDPVRLRSLGFDGMGIHSSDHIEAGSTGLYVVGRGKSPPAAADLVGSTPDASTEGPSWQVYRLRP